MRIATVALLLMSLSRVAAAQSGQPPPPPAGYPPPPPGWMPVAPVAYQPPPPPHRVFSLTISPIHLALPVVELTGEIRAHDKLGIAFIGGVGRYTDKSVNISAGVYELGAQLRFYAVGDFRHGLQLGAEVLYLHMSQSNLSLRGEGLAVGPFMGYKVIANAGFTFDAQVGAQYLGLRATDGYSAETGEEFILLLNLNVGWSF